MTEEYYEFEKNPEIHYYDFFSTGPKGNIRKVIQFQQISIKENIYNLGFGDYDEVSKEISDMTISNNHDTKKGTFNCS